MMAKRTRERPYRWSGIKSSDHFDLVGGLMCSRWPYDQFLDATLTVVDSHTARQHGLLDGVCWVRELFDSAPGVVERNVVRKVERSRLRWVFYSLVDLALPVSFQRGVRFIISMGERS
jgi:hypothetical protein